MLHRVTDAADPSVPRVVRLRELLDAQPLDGARLPAVTVGRGDDADVQLDCVDLPCVLSRRHAVVTCDGEAYTLLDSDALNGTYVRARGRVWGLATGPCGAEHRALRRFAMAQVNAVRLPRRGSRTLRVGDVITFGPLSTVRGLQRDAALRYAPSLLSCA